MSSGKYSGKGSNSKKKARSNKTTNKTPNKNDQKSDEKEEKESNSRGIPQMTFVENPYKVVYSGNDDRYITEIDERLGYVLKKYKMIK